MRKDSIYEAMQNDIMNANLSEADKNKMLKNVMKLKDQRVNIMITGATGCGKSSTINAMFDTEVAKVGVGVDPETMEIEKYELDNLILWDTPGLGDGKEADNRHAKNIIKKLSEVDENGDALIDLVLVILDGGTRDLGTSYELINSVIIPNLGKGKENRILVAINQADMAMKGRNWDYDKNEPNQQLVNFLEEKVRSVRDRVYEATGVRIEPIYYSAGYKEEGGEQGYTPCVDPRGTVTASVDGEGGGALPRREWYMQIILMRMQKCGRMMMNCLITVRKPERASLNPSQKALLREQILVVPLAAYLAAWVRLLAVVLELLLVELSGLSVDCLDKEVHYEQII